MRPLPRLVPLPPAGVQRLAALAPLSGEERQMLAAAAARARAVEVRREIVGEGRPAPEPMLVLDGWAARVRILDDGRRQFLSFLLPGDLIGLCRQRQPLAASTIIALTRVLLCPAPAAAAESGLEQAYGVSHALDEAYLLAHITRLGRLSAQERIGDLLLEFHERLSLAGLSEKGRFDVPLTQEMVADALGLTSVHVNRMLQQARRDGDLHWERGRVSLTNPARLGEKLGRQAPRVTAAPAGGG